MGQTMAVFVVSFVIFVVSALVLAFAQWLRKAPLPVGCAPENGVCCRAGGYNADASTGDARGAEVCRIARASSIAPVNPNPTGSDDRAGA